MAKLDLPKHVVSRRGGRLYYFRHRWAENGARREKLTPLPHPLSGEFRAAYNRAWFDAFGVWPDESLAAQSVAALVRRHMAESQSYAQMSAKARDWRDRAAKILEAKWGSFDARDVKPLHAQALYDKIAAGKLPTANRLCDDFAAIFAWGVPRGLVEVNPFAHVERARSEEGYEPWPQWALEKLFLRGREHIVDVALCALYTGADLGDLVERLTDANIDGTVWTMRRGKTRRRVRMSNRIELHPLVMAVVEKGRAAKRAASIVDPDRPLLLNSRGQPWGKGFGASWRKELIRLELHEVAPRLTFKGLRPTNATLIADAAARGETDASRALARVRAMLGHHSDQMAAHYARRAEVEVSNRGSVSLLPEIRRGNGTEPDGETEG